MSAIDSALALKRIFGLDGEVKDNIHYIDEAQVVYPAGNNLVCYHLEKKTQRIIPLSGPGFPDLHNGTGQITALAVSPYSSTRSKLLAVAEKGENTKSTITIFDLATLKRKGKHPLVNQEVTSPAALYTVSVIMLHALPRFKCSHCFMFRLLFVFLYPSLPSS